MEILIDQGLYFGITMRGPAMGTIMIEQRNNSSGMPSVIVLDIDTAEEFIAKLREVMNCSEGR